MLISLPSRPSLPIPFTICIYLLQFTRPDAFCLSVKQLRNFSSMSKVPSDIILCIPTAALNAFSYSESELISSKYDFDFSFSPSSLYLRHFLSFPCVPYSMQFAAVGFFFRQTFNFSAILGPLSCFKQAAN